MTGDSAGRRRSGGLDRSSGGQQPASGTGDSGNWRGQATLVDLHGRFLLDLDRNGKLGLGRGNRKLSWLDSNAWKDSNGQVISIAWDAHGQIISSSSSSTKILARTIASTALTPTT